MTIMTGFNRIARPNHQSKKEIFEIPDLTCDNAKRILSFIGYGTLSAPFWFIGLEEGLKSDDHEDLQHNLRSRGAWLQTMDLAEACLRLRDNRSPLNIESYKYAWTPTWWWMARVCRYLTCGPDSGTDEKAKNEAKKKTKNYVRHNLGRKNGQSFLTELSPIPARNLNEGAIWLNFFRGVEAKTDTLINQRLSHLRSLIAKHQPPFIFCYGAERDKFKALLPGREWKPVGDRSEISVLPNSIAVLMPFFGVGQLTDAEFNLVMEQVQTTTLAGTLPNFNV